MAKVITVRGLGKEYRRYHSNRPITLQEAVVRAGVRRMASVEKFWAVRGVSFEAHQGQMIGMIGRNGAGKSTLLRLIGGVGSPDEGSVNVTGRIGALLDLGIGFHPDLTGRENVFVAGVIAGLTRREVAQRLEAIVDFAELEEAIDSPLRTYSSGMTLRLAFSVAVHTDPDVLLIDEVLAVGDVSFQQKCLQKIANFKSQGGTVLLVSHDIELVRRLCNEVLWLDAGKVVAQGSPEVVVGQYVAEMAQETIRRTPRSAHVLHTPAGLELRVNENRFGSQEIEIVAVRLLDDRRLPVETLDSGEALRVEIDYLAREAVPTPHFGVTITRDDGLVCYDSTGRGGVGLASKWGQIALVIERLDLNEGRYFVDVGVYSHDWAWAYDYHWHAYPLLIQADGTGKGVLYTRHHWETEGAAYVLDAEARAEMASRPEHS